MNVNSDLILTGYITGQFDMADKILASSPSPERLLDLVLLADEFDSDKGSHTAPPPGHWQRLRDDAMTKLIQHMRGPVSSEHQDWQDQETIWEPKMFRLALRSIPGMAARELLTLFIQASETAYLHEAGPMQDRWEKVSIEARAEILRRVTASHARSCFEGRPADDIEVVGSDDNDDYVSLREALRVAEQAFESNLSDAKLLDLYLLVETCSAGPDEEVFDEIIDPIEEILEERIARGAPDLVHLPPVGGFDYPDHHAEALKAVLTGRLPNTNLLTLYRIAWDCEPNSPWVPIVDLCRAQILCRMSPPHSQPTGRYWPDWQRTELVRRLKSYEVGRNI